MGSFGSLGYAQVAATTARISGTVMDPNGAVVLNADVVVRDDATGKEYKVNTGGDGNFSVPSVPVGTYSVTVTAQGFKQTVITNVKAELGQTATVRVTL